MSDPLAEAAAKRHLFDQTIAFHTDKLDGIIGAYRQHAKKYDRETLLANMAKTLTDVGNGPDDLAHMLVIAIDRLART